MANKKVEIRPVGDNADYGDMLFPKTSADMVVDEVNGGTVQDHLSNGNSHIPCYQSEGAWEYYSVNGSYPLVVGGGFSFIANHTNIGQFTELTYRHKGIDNVARILDGKGRPTKPNSIIENAIYTVRYNGTNFFLQGAEGGEYGTATAAEVMSGVSIGTEDGLVNGTLDLTGSAIAGQVLSGQTFYRTDPKTKMTGTMTNNTNTTTTGTRRASSTGYIDLSPADGYYSGTTASKTRISDSNFTAANIKSGVSMFGLTGTSSIQYSEGTTNVYPTQNQNYGRVYSVSHNCGFPPRYYTAYLSGLHVNDGVNSFSNGANVIIGNSAGIMNSSSTSSKMNINATSGSPILTFTNSNCRISGNMIYLDFSITTGLNFHDPFGYSYLLNVRIYAFG